ncbi:hypothetical protein CAEBREN_15109 [Caenorhabditis brenneri]|uniref:Uncharacterized protein n=1 Tax=Caenorhabditis brenneri TaxID=135651 RepID=G0NHL7_CAEBE|nr:hypothetical protein CAEBREN_15109 [Caenorhabditis brenneri]
MAQNGKMDLRIVLGNSTQQPPNEPNIREKIVAEANLKSSSNEIKKEKVPTQIEPLSISDQLQQMIDYMNLREKSHVDVFPDAPRKDQISIPTGGLAKCICSPGCTKELPQPAYLIIGDSEEDERWGIKPQTRMASQEAALAHLIDAVKDAHDELKVVNDLHKALRGKSSQKN